MELNKLNVDRIINSLSSRAGFRQKEAVRKKGTSEGKADENDSYWFTQAQELIILMKEPLVQLGIIADDNNCMTVHAAETHSETYNNPAFKDPSNTGKFDPRVLERSIEQALLENTRNETDRILQLGRQSFIGGYFK